MREIVTTAVLALALLATGCGMSPDEARGRARDALAALGDGDRARAQELVAEALEAAPGEAEVQEAAGRIALAQLSFGRAREHLQKAVHLADHPRRRGLLGRALLGMGRVDDAADELDDAISQGADDPEVLRDAVYVYSRAGRVRESLELAERAMARDGASPRTQLRVAAAYLRGGKQAEASHILRTLAPDLLTELEDQLLLGQVAYELEDADRAVQAFEAAAQALPKVGRVHYNLGTARILSGDFRKAKADFDKAVSLDPSDAQAKGQLAYCLSRIGRKETARKVIAEALRQAPEDPVLQVLAQELEK
jgi:tetratricopeptide (TPR) repeat protein